MGRVENSLQSDNIAYQTWLSRLPDKQVKEEQDVAKKSKRIRGAIMAAGVSVVLLIGWKGEKVLDKVTDSKAVEVAVLTAGVVVGGLSGGFGAINTVEFIRKENLIKGELKNRNRPQV